MSHATFVVFKKRSWRRASRRRTAINCEFVQNCTAFLQLSFLNKRATLASFFIGAAFTMHVESSMCQLKVIVVVVTLDDDALLTAAPVVVRASKLLSKYYFAICTYIRRYLFHSNLT